MPIFHERPEKTHVNRVTIEVAGERREVADCWIYIDAGSRTVTVWEAQSADTPLMTAPIEATLIEWQPPH